MAMANRLWGFDGQVIISMLSVGFYLVEFPSEKLCNWVMERSWHVHHTALVLRRWYAGIEPLDLTEKPAPVWVTMEKVPPQLITVEGVSWLASQLGKPVNKFIREGLTVKVCVYLKEDSKDVLIVAIDGKQIDIEIKYPKVRQFSNASKKIWQVKDVEVVGSEASKDPISVAEGDMHPVSMEPSPGGSQPMVSKDTGKGLGNVPNPAVSLSPKLMSGRKIEDGLICSDSDEEADVEGSEEERKSPGKSTFGDYYSISKKVPSQRGLNVSLMPPGRLRTRRK
ncbi:hypothetical protein LINPERPRIM_LOCUS21476 [Linum perenne]